MAPGHSAGEAEPCHVCGYDVRATIAAGIERCPECGTPVVRDRARADGEYQAANRIARRAAIAALLLTFGLGFASNFFVGLVFGTLAFAYGVVRAAQRLTRLPESEKLQHPAKRAYFAFMGVLAYSVLFLSCGYIAFLAVTAVAVTFGWW